MCLVVDATERRTAPTTSCSSALARVRRPGVLRAQQGRPRDAQDRGCCPLLERWRAGARLPEIVPISAIDGTNCDRAPRSPGRRALPEHPACFPTDRDQRSAGDVLGRRDDPRADLPLHAPGGPVRGAVRVEELTERQRPAVPLHPGDDLRRAGLAEGHRDRQGRRDAASGSGRRRGASWSLLRHQGRTSSCGAGAAATGGRTSGRSASSGSCSRPEHGPSGTHRRRVVIGSFPLGESDRVVEILLARVRQGARRGEGGAAAALALRQRARALHASASSCSSTPGRSELVRVDHFDILHPFVAVRERLEPARARRVGGRVRGAADRRARPPPGALRAARPRACARWSGASPPARVVGVLRRALPGSARPPPATRPLRGVRPRLSRFPTRARRGRGRAGLRGVPRRAPTRCPSVRGPGRRARRGCGRGAGRRRCALPLARRWTARAATVLDDGLVAASSARRRAHRFLRAVATRAPGVRGRPADDARRLTDAVADGILRPCLPRWMCSSRSASAAASSSSRARSTAAPAPAGTTGRSASS